MEKLWVLGLSFVTALLDVTALYFYRYRSGKKSDLDDYSPFYMGIYYRCRVHISSFRA
jgi:hypothetical protein